MTGTKTLFVWFNIDPLFVPLSVQVILILQSREHKYLLLMNLSLQELTEPVFFLPRNNAGSSSYNSMETFRVLLSGLMLVFDWPLRIKKR